MHLIENKNQESLEAKLLIAPCKELKPKEWRLTVDYGSESFWYQNRHMFVGLEYQLKYWTGTGMQAMPVKPTMAELTWSLWRTLGATGCHYEDAYDTRSILGPAPGNNLDCTCSMNHWDHGSTFQDIFTMIAMCQTEGHIFEMKSLFINAPQLPSPIFIKLGGLWKRKCHQIHIRL